MFGLPWQLAGALGIGLLVSLGFNGCQHQSAKLVAQELETAKNGKAAAEAAITGKDSVIAQLRGSLEQWQQIAADEAAKARAAGDRAEAAESELRALRADLHERERADDAIPECDRFLESDIAAACPARAAGVRERAANGLRRPASRDPRPVH